MDGFLTQLMLKLDLEGHLFDLSFTYGLLDNLDVNIDIPCFALTRPAG